MPEIIYNADADRDDKPDMRLLSNGIKEIISQKPVWIVQNGIIVFLCIITFLLAITFFISYPEVVNTNARLTSANAPKEVVAWSEGVLMNLCVRDGDSIEQDQVIGYLESTPVKEISQQRGLFIQSSDSLNSGFDNLTNKYIIRSPIAGHIAFSSVLQENMQIKQGQVICYINPANTIYYATVLIPQENYGKIRPGDRVLLHLPAYPPQEFGTIEGRLEFIASIPSDSGFIGKVALPNGLTTSYGKRLPLKDGLLARAEIITLEQRLSDRLFGKIRATIK